MNVLLDTNILIDCLRGVPLGVEEVKRHPTALISIVSWIEVMTGAQNGEDSHRFRDFLADFLCIDLDANIGGETAALRQRYRLKLPDAAVLATAMVHQVPLLTRNTRDFPESMPGVRIPYRL